MCACYVRFVCMYVGMCAMQNAPIANIVPANVCMNIWVYVSYVDICLHIVYMHACMHSSIHCVIVPAKVCIYLHIHVNHVCVYYVWYLCMYLDICTMFNEDVFSYMHLHLQRSYTTLICTCMYTRVHTCSILYAHAARALFKHEAKELHVTFSAHVYTLYNTYTHIKSHPSLSFSLMPKYTDGVPIRPMQNAPV